MGKDSDNRHWVHEKPSKQLMHLEGSTDWRKSPGYRTHGHTHTLPLAKTTTAIKKRTLHLTVAVNKNLAYDALLGMDVRNSLNLSPQQTERTTHIDMPRCKYPQLVTYADMPDQYSEESDSNFSDNGQNASVGTEVDQEDNTVTTTTLQPKNQTTFIPTTTAGRTMQKHGTCRPPRF